MKLGAQETLDELFVESLIPFRLSARNVESLGMEEYIVRFHDSRLRSVDVSWKPRSDIQDGFSRRPFG